MANVPCPSAGILSAFAVGCTTDAEALEIETHLAACPQCVAILDGVTADSLVAAVKASLPAVRDGVEHSNSQPVGFEFPPIVRAETTQIYPNVPTDTNLSPVGGTQSHPTEEYYRFLSPSTEPGTIGQLGPYRILGQLGSGGMGAVFRAEDPQLLRPVALKVMRPHALGAAEASQRFLAEARAAARLKHDHVVTVYQVGEDRGVAFIAMELLEGESLDSRLARESRLSVAEACRIGMETASALSAAHTAGLIHRDIKPANLWLDRSSGRTKVLDFGLARATDGDVDLTSSGAILGTPAFMAPEQARGESVDGRTDLFALGVVLYRAITGQLPFRGQSSVGTLLAVTTYSPPTPRSLRAEIPQDLSTLVMKLLAKDPAERPQTAAEVLVQLAAIRTRIEQGKLERPDGLGRRSWKAIVAGLLVCGALLAGVVVIIRDKNGNKVAEVTVPNGTSVEVLTEAPAALAKTDPPLAKAAQSLAPELRVIEPPPLEDWLNDRKILTVAQDGRGQFPTIQKALLALQPGQAIQVLGPGPYREQFKIPELPSDSGIFSSDGAVIECPEWQEVYQLPDAAGKMHQVYTGHILGRARGFRLNGLTFTFPARGMRRVERMTMLHSQNLTIEDCVIRATDGGKHQFINISNWGDPAALPMAATIRNCVIESQLWFATEIPQSKILVEKNLFLGPTDEEHLVIADSHLASAVIRNNVITANNETSITIARLKDCDYLEIVNNTLGGINGIYFIRTCPKTATIRNNLHSRTGALVVLIEGAHEQLGNLFQNQEFDHNAYHTMMVSSAGPVTSRSMIGDQIGDAKFLSNAAENPNYLRVSRNDQPLAKGGVGGDLPTYIGALSPGPIGDRGDWFTSLQTRRLKSAPNAPPVAPPETQAPELAEWLKGRTILTVAQDGRGQFKSIQEALNQLAPGQAVEVLDRGPYHERLHVTLPADCGLFSRVQTIVGFPRWELSSMASVGIDGKPLTNHQGHEFMGSDGFRLHGFDLQFPPLDGTYEDGHLYRRLTFRMPRDCVIENCLIRRVGLGSYEGEAVEVINWESEMSVVLRDCVIDGALAVVSNRSKPLAAGDRGARIFLQRVCFPGTTMHHQLLTSGNALKELSVRDCIFAGAVDANIFVDDCQPHTAVEVTNCYLNGDRGIWFHKTAPEAGVVVRNNLRTGDGIVYFDEIAGKFREQAQQRWQVGHNAYGFVNKPNAPPVSLRQSATDVITKPQFLATNFDAPNAFRLSSDDQLGRSGAAEDLPAYIGPFPPGPAPVEGDWFTRLQKLWFDKRMSEEAQPARLVTEPGPLDEWLKGRTILTVAQDGSGQFQTIQAALDALQAGQVVQVLDQGPYRERLELHTPPPDIGLISSVQTRVELTDLVPSEGVIKGRGHFVEKANGLRIHGVEFQIPQSPANVVTIGFHISESRGMVLEDCAVRRQSSPESQSLVVASVRGGIAQPTVIRDCYIEQGIQIYTLPPEGSALVTRNYISGDLHGLMAGGSFQHCVIRNNIFSKTLKFPFIQQVVHADWFELSNNSFFSISEPVLMDSLTATQLNERAIRMEKGDQNPPPPVERGHAPTGRGAIYNNLHNRPGFLKVTGGAENEPWTWLVGYNCYPGDGGVPARNALPRESNIIATPIFYSILPGEPNFARLQPESPGATSQAGGKWPNYTGALPPGPVPADGDWFTRLQKRWMKQE